MDPGEKKIFPSSKKINIGATSSLSDLKAELLRRKNEAASKSKADEAPETEVSSVQSTSSTTPSWLSKAKDLEEKGELVKIKHKSKSKKGKSSKSALNELEEAELRRSREALERKCKLYEEMYEKAKQPRPLRDSDESSSDEENDNCLVDFDTKILLGHKLPFEEQEMVEFTDSLGRTRKVPKKDLDFYKKQDEELRIEAERRKEDNDDEDDEIGPRLSEAALSEPVEDTPMGPIRYSQLAKEEVRDHGVGYYQFSADEDERVKQRRLLDSLHHETKRHREKNLKGEADSQHTEDIETKEKELRIEKRTQDVLAGKKLKTRRWDVGKRDEMGRTVTPTATTSTTSKSKSMHKQHMKALREERNPEFAPPPIYHEISHPPKKFKHNESPIPAPSKKIEDVIAEQLAMFRNSSNQKE